MNPSPAILETRAAVETKANVGGAFLFPLPQQVKNTITLDHQSDPSNGFRPWPKLHRLLPWPHRHWRRPASAMLKLWLHDFVVDAFSCRRAYQAGPGECQV